MTLPLFFLCPSSFLVSERSPHKRIGLWVSELHQRLRSKKWRVLLGSVGLAKAKFCGVDTPPSWWHVWLAVDLLRDQVGAPRKKNALKPPGLGNSERSQSWPGCKWRSLRNQCLCVHGHTCCSWLQLMHLIILLQAKHLTSAKEMLARHWNPGKNTKRLTWLWESFVAVTAPVNKRRPFQISSLRLRIQWNQNPWSNSRVLRFYEEANN